MDIAVGVRVAVAIRIAVGVRIAVGIRVAVGVRVAVVSESLSNQSAVGIRALDVQSRCRYIPYLQPSKRLLFIQKNQVGIKKFLLKCSCFLVGLIKLIVQQTIHLINHLQI
ncbi:hypothetical protein AKN92_07725 [Thiopseudomonas alkaliphila]|nr:hypothetical protein AKN92_07725 [Thiopseudomonas alkaliphila]